MPDIAKILDTVICGDVFDKLPEIPTGIIHCIITSPPYWGLRDYGVDGQIGLEKTPEEYIAKMVQVFREVWRVLRDDGTLWLNMGDSYVGSGKGGGGCFESMHESRRRDTAIVPRQNNGAAGLKPKDLCGIPWRVALALQADGWYLRQDIIWHKPNPMPESVTDRCTKAHEYIFLLTKKPRYYCDMDAIRVPQVESNDARPRMGQGPNTQYNQKRKNWHDHKDDLQVGNRIGPKEDHPAGKNKRSVWTANDLTDFVKWIIEEHPEIDVNKYFDIEKKDVWTVPTAPYKEAHFATFPPKLIEPCILAGTSDFGCCDICSMPWERVVKKEGKKRKTLNCGNMDDRGVTRTTAGLATAANTGFVKNTTIGWRPMCSCWDDEYRKYPRSGKYKRRKGQDVCDTWFGRVRKRPGKDSWPHKPAIVLDPFMGSGTVAAVAYENNRYYIGIDLNPDRKIQKRIQDVRDKYPLFEPAKGGG